MTSSDRAPSAFRKLLTLLLPAVLLLIALTACGSTEPDPDAGVYRCVAVEVRGLALDPEELYPDGVSLELQDRGRGILTCGEESGKIDWSLEDGRFVLRVDGENCYGTLQDGVIDVDLVGNGVILTFLKEGAVLPDRGPDESVLAAQAAYTGDWYGFWRVTDARGTMPDSWYDCFAVIEAGEDGHSEMTIWDERGSRAKPIAMVDLRFETEKKKSLAFSTSGFFWFDELGKDEWALRLKGKEPTLTVTGSHDAEEEKFDYEIVLRPWGAGWDDREADDRPWYYEDWYLPIKDGPMPDEMGPVESPLP